MIEKCISDLFDTLDAVAPEADGPVAMVSYGSAAEQKTIHGKWESMKKSLEDWENVPHFYTKPDAVAVGTAVLGAVSHGRVSVAHQVYPEVVHQLPGDRVRRADHHLVHVATRQHRESALVQVHDRVVVALVAAGRRGEGRPGDQGLWSLRA